MDELAKNQLVNYLFKNSKLPLIELDSTDTVVASSPGALKIFPDHNKIIGMNWMDLLMEVTPESDQSNHIRTYLIRSGSNASKVIAYTLEGETSKVVMIETMMIMESEIVEELSAMNIEMSNLSRRVVKQNHALNKANEKIKSLSNHDYLTNIYNRRYFFTRLEEEIALSERLECGSIGLISFDIDDFKQINDRFGHDAGDEVLKRLTEAVNGVIRNEDVFARVGGEEFSILVRTNCGASLDAIAEKIRATCEALTWPFNGLNRVTISVGVTCMKAEDDLKSFIKRCDNSLYEAKRLGKNRVVS